MDHLAPAVHYSTVMFHRTAPLLIHPLALVGLFLSKKAIALKLAQWYGLPRLYRQLAKTNRAAFAFTSARYASNRDVIQRLFRLPGEIEKFVASEGPSCHVHSVSIASFFLSTKQVSDETDMARMLAEFERKYTPLPAGTLVAIFAPKH